MAAAVINGDGAAQGVVSLPAAPTVRSSADACPMSELDALLPDSATPPSPSARLTVLELFRLLSWKHVVGVGLLVAVAVIWVGASELVQFIFGSTGSTPWLFITTVNVSEFAVLLPLEAARELLVARWYGVSPLPTGESAPSCCATRSDWVRAARAAAVVRLPAANSRCWICMGQRPPPFLAQVAPIWVVAQSTFNWALAGVSVSVSTVLATTSCVWTFILSLALLGERFSWVKAAGVVLTLGGAALVSLERGGNGTWWGVALSLLSAVAYGCYTTALRRLAPEGGGVRIQLLFGFVGVFCAATLGPLSAALHATGALRVPPLDGGLVGLILTKGLVDNVLSDLLWAWAIQLTSATLATVGLALTIPTAMVADLLVHGAPPGPLLAAGSGLVVLGFILTTLSLGERAEERVAPGEPAAAPPELVERDEGPVAHVEAAKLLTSA